MSTSLEAGTAAVFLDRDGVLVEDIGAHADPTRFRLLDDVPDALTRLAAAGYVLVVISNQTVVARGLANESEVDAANAELDRKIVASGGRAPDRHYYCPHHPKATVEAYRVNCDCRKPAPGLLIRAAADLRIRLDASFMIGDRITDVAAGRSVGCRTILVRTGRHDDPPIVTSVPLPSDVAADHVADGLSTAVDWLLTP